MNERAGRIVTRLDELLAALERLSTGDGSDWHRDSTGGNREALALFSTESEIRETVARWLGKGRLEKLVALWVRGFDLDWTKLYTKPPHRLHLPSYPFARERYWVPSFDGAAQQQPVAGASAPAAPEPQAPTSSQPEPAAPAAPSPHDTAVTTPSARRMSRVVLSDLDEPTPAVGEVALRPPPGRSQTESESPPASITPPAPPAARARRDLRDIREHLLDLLAEALFLPRSDVNIDRTFVEMGMDSIIGVEFVRAINRHYDTNIPATRVYDHPSVRAFSEFLETELSRAQPAAPPRALPSLPPSTREHPRPSSLDDLLQGVAHGALDVENAARLIADLV